MLGRLGWLCLLVGLLAACASGPWPSTSLDPVVPLAHPTLEERIQTLEYQLEAGFRFVAFGDQRALADGEWQAMMRVIGNLESGADEPPLLFLLDTGDIVQDGSHTDQFGMLTGILSPAAHLPYVLGVGNHEVANNREGPSRDHLARFLARTGLPVDRERMYFRLDLGPLRLICLDSNDLVYGDGEPAMTPRGRDQLDWLEEQLRDGPGRPPTTLLVLHHPFLQTSSKHRPIAQHLWTLEHRGRRLVDLLADGGVDLVLSGHTHTYERFTLTRSDGAGFGLVNLSGRPRDAFLWFGAGARRAEDIRADADTWLTDAGWDLGDWSVTQDAVMGSPELNQYGIFTVGPDGQLGLEVRFLAREDARTVRTDRAEALLAR